MLTGSPIFCQGQVSKMFTFGNIQVVIVACSFPCYQYCTLDIISYHPQQNHIYKYICIHITVHIHTKGVGMGVLHVTRNSLVHLVHPFASEALSQTTKMWCCSQMSPFQEPPGGCNVMQQVNTLQSQCMVTLEYLHIITY